VGVNPNAEDNRRHWFWSRSGPVSSCRRRPVRLDGRSRGRRPRGAEDRTSPPPSPYEAAAHAHATDGTYAPASGCGKACRACAINIGARSAGVPISSWGGFGLLAVSQLKTPRLSARGLFAAPKVPAGAAGRRIEAPTPALGPRGIRQSKLKPAERHGPQAPLSLNFRPHIRARSPRSGQAGPRGGARFGG